MAQDQDQDKYQISVKLSPELKQHLKAYKNSRGKRSLKAAVVEILENYFHSTQLPNQPQTMDSSIGRIASLEAKVTYLSEQVEVLKQAQQASGSVSSIADAAPTKLKPLVEPPPNSSSTKQVESETTTSTEDFDDDMYDEPDEILYNFLEPWGLLLH